jgi:hypothetical protein
MGMRNRERKGGREYGTSHQSDLQVLSHVQVYPRRKDTKSSTDLPGT